MIIRNPEPMSLRKKITAWVIFFALVTLFIFAVSYAINEEAKQQDTMVKTAPSKMEPHIVQIDEPLYVEQLRFSVDKFDIKNQYAGKQGKWVIVSVTANNTGGNPATVDNGMFILLDSQGRKFKNDPMNDIGRDHFTLEQINPGISKSGIVSFEVPQDADHFMFGIRSGMFLGDDYQYFELK